MADTKFTNQFPGYKNSEQGKVVLEMLRKLHKTYLRILITAEAESPGDKGKVQLLQKLGRDLFGIDLLEEKSDTR